MRINKRSLAANGSISFWEHYGEIFERKIITFTVDFMRFTFGKNHQEMFSLVLFIVALQNIDQSKGTSHHTTGTFDLTHTCRP